MEVERWDCLQSSLLSGGETEGLETEMKEEYWLGSLGLRVPEKGLWEQKGGGWGER